MATLINTYAENTVTALISQEFGSDLAGLNLDEILNLLWDVTAVIGDSDEPLGDDVMTAAESLREVVGKPVEAIALILGLTDLMDARVKSPLTDYVSNYWTDAAVDAFGERLENLPLNDHSWILFHLLQTCVDLDDVSQEIFAKSNEIDEWLQENAYFTIEEHEIIPVARAIAHIAVERFYSQVDAA